MEIAQMKNLYLKAIFCGSLSILISIGSTQIVFGDENQKPDGFFQKDFAAGFESEAVDAFDNKNEARPPAPGIKNGQAPEQPSDSTETRTDEEENTGESFEKRTAKIEAIGAIIEARDTESARESLVELSNTAITHDLRIGKVYLVGGIPNMDDLKSILARLLVRGGDVKFPGKVPSQYPAKLSPSWIITTADGEMLLDGIGPIGSHLDSKGDLVLPKTPDNSGTI